MYICRTQAFPSRGKFASRICFRGTKPPNPGVGYRKSTNKWRTTIFVWRSFLQITFSPTRNHCRTHFGTTIKHFIYAYDMFFLASFFLFIIIEVGNGSLFHWTMIHGNLRGPPQCQTPIDMRWPYEQLHLFTMMKTRCGVKQGLWKCWFCLQNEIKTRWRDSKNEVGLKHFKTILKRGHSWWKRDHSWWKSAETWKTRLKRGGGTPWIFFTAATS